MLPRVLRRKEVALLLYRVYRTRGVLVGLAFAIGGPHSRRPRALSPPSIPAPCSSLVTPLPSTPFSLLLHRVYRVLQDLPHAGFLPSGRSPAVSCSPLRFGRFRKKSEPASYCEGEMEGRRAGDSSLVLLAIRRPRHAPSRGLPSLLLLVASSFLVVFLRPFFVPRRSTPCSHAMDLLLGRINPRAIDGGTGTQSGPDSMRETSDARHGRGSHGHPGRRKK